MGNGREGLFANNIRKISDIRSAISRAEERGNEEEVIILEAELRAAEKGEVFKREDFLRERAKSKIKPKHRVLRAMQDVSRSPKGTFWGWDGIHEQDSQYAYQKTFGDILGEFEVEDFEDLLSRKNLELRRKQNVLDLFGGGYFLNNLNNVQNIFGTRVEDEDVLIDLYKGSYRGIAASSSITQGDEAKLEKLRQIKENKKRALIVGDLYDSTTWKKIKTEQQKRVVESFDLIVCRPQAAFGSTENPSMPEQIENSGQAIEEIYVALLERALKLLSPDGGILFTQMPRLETPAEVVKNFWEKFVSKKESEGYRFIFGQGMRPGDLGTFAMERRKAR